MPGCYLRVAGTDFDPDSYLASTSLTPAKVWHVGDPLAASGPRASRFREWAGFTCDVSDADGDLERQIDHAIAFLTQHRDDLLLLNADSTIEDRRLDFGFDSRLGVGDAMHDARNCKLIGKIMNGKLMGARIILPSIILPRLPYEYHRAHHQCYSRLKSSQRTLVATTPRCAIQILESAKK